MVTSAIEASATTATPVTEAQLRELCNTVWETTLKQRLTASRRPIAPPRGGEGDALSACVHITGAWEGAVQIDCPEAVARAAAMRMFALSDAAAAGRDEMTDAIGELANMVGGNVKALLPEPSRLSLPSVVVGGDYQTRVPGAVVALSAAFDCGPHPVWVRLLRRRRAEPRG